MQKFFVDSPPPVGGSYIITGDNFDHIRVLRLRAGDEIVLCDGDGYDYFCRILELLKNNAVINVESLCPSLSEPNVDCHIFTAMPKADKLEHIIQKATELGAVSVTAFVSSFCVSRPDDKAIAKKLDRWQKIALSAASQCGRGKVPRVSYIPDYASALKKAAEYDLPIFLYENEEDNSLKASLSGGEYRSISILSGAEGGFSQDEAQAAMAAGLISCSLGKRILRCETAPLCALSAVMYHTGNL